MAQQPRNGNTGNMRQIRRIGTVVSAAGLLAIVACSDKTPPERIVEQYYTQHTSLGGKVLGSRPLAANGNQAVFATSIVNNDSVSEWYTFLAHKRFGWKVVAATTMRFPAAYYTLIDSLQHGWQPPANRPELRANLALTVASDSAIKAYLVDHRAEMDSLAAVVIKRAVSSMVEVGSPIRPEIRDGKVLPTNRNARIEQLLERTRLTTAFHDDRYPGCTFLRISGMGRSQVGYLYAPQGCQLPQMSPDRFIYVERVIGDWYVYKAI